MERIQISKIDRDSPVILEFGKFSFPSEFLSDLEESFHNAYREWREDPTQKENLHGEFVLELCENIEKANHVEVTSLPIYRDTKDSGYLHVNGYKEIVESRTTITMQEARELVEKYPNSAIVEVNYRCKNCEHESGFSHCDIYPGPDVESQGIPCKGCGSTEDMALINNVVDGMILEVDED